MSLDSCVRFAYNAEFSAEEALNFTRHSFPSVTLAEVKMLYEEFNERMPSEKSEDTNKKSSVEASKRASLEGVPAEVLGEIFKHSTTEDQNSLHKTSFGLSTFVDNTFKTFEGIQVFLTNSAIQMAVEEQKPKVVRDGQPPRKRKHSEDEEQHEKTIPEVLAKLKLVFALQNVKIGKLSFQHGAGVDQQRRNKLYSGIQSIFEELKTEIHVEELTIAVGTPESFLLIVSKIKVGPLVHWCINNTNGDYDQVFSMDEIIQSPHWNNLTEFSLRRYKAILKPVEFVHIPTVSISPLDVTIEDILSYRDKLLKGANVEYHQFILNSVYGLDGVLDALRPFRPAKNLRENGGSYLCDNGKWLYFKCYQHLLHFSNKSIFR